MISRVPEWWYFYKLNAATTVFEYGRKGLNFSQVPTEIFWGTRGDERREPIDEKLNSLSSQGKILMDFRWSEWGNYTFKGSFSVRVSQTESLLRLSQVFSLCILHALYDFAQEPSYKFCYLLSAWNCRV